MQRVLVVDKNGKPLMPCHPARARELLDKGRAKLLRRFPFTIIILDRDDGETQAIRFKVDPGAKTSGFALVANFKWGLRCIWAAELIHRGWQIRDNLLSRRQLRRGRRSRKTRYRPARFENRTRKKACLPPSLQSRIDNILSWFSRLSRFVPITNLAMEWIRFDTQAMQNPEISGLEYQQGTLMGYEVREYLLEKWGRQCAYCGATDKPLQVEHIIPKSRGGSNRVSNLTISCERCNRDKGTQTADEFGYRHIQAQAKKPLRDAAAINATRWELLAALQETELELEKGTGGQTKFNRTQQGYPKTHWLDAVCVGASGEQVFVPETIRPLQIKAVGRGSRQMCRMDRFGFPRTKPKRFKRVHGFQTGDMVKAVLSTGKKIGSYIGRVAVRTSGSFNISTAQGTIQGISYKYCRLLQRNDGYAYSFVSAMD